MSTDTTTTGGFVGDPTQAFTPPAASGCCGSTPTAASDADPAEASGCCGMPATAPAESGSDSADVKATGCCG